MPSGKVLADLGVLDIATGIRRGELTATAVVEACLARIRAVDAELRAWTHVDEAGALAAARAADAGRVRGILHGVPIGVKDIFEVAGLPMTAGTVSTVFHTRPERDARSVASARASGGIVLGKTATTEFAFRDPAPTRNPWNREHTPGGSSSGSAAAVATRMVPLALGTQTVGSVLRPAAYCGVVGVKPAHGYVPVDGVVPLAWSLDHVGVFARSVVDAALGLAVLSGREGAAAAALAGPLEDVPALARALVGDTAAREARPPRLALAPELLARALPDTARRVRETVERLRGAGATIVEVRLPVSFATIHDAGQVLLEAEAAAYHEAAYAKDPQAFREGIRGLVAAGLARRAVDYVTADRARRAFRADVTALLGEHDALLSPTAPGPAPAGLAWTGDATLCAPWSSAGVPAVSLPTGVGADGLPHALQLVQAPDGLPRLLATAAWCERVIGFAARPRL